MRLIKQKDDGNECGVACVAMLSGCTYAEAFHALYLKGKAKRTSLADMRRALAQFETNLEVRRKMRRVRRNELPDLGADALLKTTPRSDGDWHWMVWDARRKKILDPKKVPYRRPRIWGAMVVERS